MEFQASVVASRDIFNASTARRRRDFKFYPYPPKGNNLLISVRRIRVIIYTRYFTQLRYFNLIHLIIDDQSQNFNSYNFYTIYTCNQLCFVYREIYVCHTLHTRW